jgi:hypothetical protein
MKKLLIALILLMGSMRMTAQLADMGIASAIMNTNPIAVGQTAQLVVEVRNFGFTNITAGCALVTISVPTAICNIVSINAASNSVWAVNFSGSLPASIQIRNLGGMLAGNGGTLPYNIVLNITGIANGGPLNLSANSTLAGNATQPGCSALGNLSTANDNVTSSIRVGPATFNWTGLTSTDWSDATNWASFFVPASIDNAVIPNVANKPQLTTGTIINNLNIDPSMSVDMNGNSFTINGAVSGTGKLKGTSSSTLTIGGAAGTLNFDQSTAATRSLKSLSVTATGSASLASSGDDLDIYSNIILSPGASLNLNNQNITLKSVGTGALQSAYIGNLTGASLTNATNITMERYVATPQRAWHLLSAKAVTGPQTIKEAWQENGGAYVAGIGTNVTSNLYSPSNGFDMVSNSASVLTYNQGGLSGASWNYGLTNTNATPLSSNPGYMVFVRGDRSQTPATVGTGPTVLRSKGTLTQGNQSAFISSTGTGLTLVGNPYASPIDIDAVLTGTTNLEQSMYVWDPSLGGNYSVGGLRFVRRNGADDYEVTPPVGIGQENTARYLHAGQAFFLRTTGTAGATDATVNFTEALKTANLSVINPIVAANTPQIITNLMVVNAGNIASLADGMRVRYDASYNANTSDDFVKMSNFGENIYSYREGKKLIVELRPMPTVYDTIFLRMNNMAQKNYRFELNALNFMTGFNAYLQDAYKGTTTPIDLTGTTNQFDFSVTAEAASANQDRFRIVFALKGPIPVTSVIVKAAQKSEDIVVDWKATSQFNINHYEVEKSTDGTNFSKVASQLPVGVNGTDATYTWLDVNAVKGANYYRIHGIGNNGENSNSNVAKVTIGNSSITIYPNPVTTRNISLQMNDMEKGVYNLKLMTTTGQVVMTTQLTHGGGNSTQAVPLLKQIANGSYRLEITKPDQSRILKDLVIADH